MILCVGDLMLDVLLLPELTAAEQGSGIVIRGGGSAANTAAWIAGCGGEAALAACVGADPVGAMLVSELRVAGVLSRVRSVDGWATGAVVVEVTTDGERTMRSARGANQTLAAGDILACADLVATWIHLTGYSLLGHAGLEILSAAAEFCRQTDGRLSFDPSSVGVVHTLGADVLLKALVVAETHLLLPNADEARALTGERDVDAACRRLAEVVPIVIVKDGPRGSVHATSGRVVRVPAARGERRDATGAGDAFDGGVLFELARGGTLEEAARTGHRVAAQAIERYGGRP